LAEAVFGAPFRRDFVSLKRAEWDEFNTVVGEWERAKYLQLW
jgi:glutamine synthetase